MDIEDFWSFVDQRAPHECWPWLRGTSSLGYGKLVLGRGDEKEPWLAHRVAWWLSRGERPKECVLHRCDNPICCNPRHLYEGTRGDNNRDRDARGRNGGHKIAGERHVHAKLTDARVLDARKRYANGEECKALAEEFGVSFSCLWSAIQGRTWKHLPVSFKPRRSGWRH